MRKRFKRFWHQMTQIDTPLVSKQYVEKTVYLLYWLGLFVAIGGFIAGIIAGAIAYRFSVFMIVALSGFGIWLALIVVCCFLTLGVLKITAIEKENKKMPEEIIIEQKKDA